MLDEAVAYVAHDSEDAATRLLTLSIETAASLKSLSERGHVVPEIALRNVRELFVGRYRLIYETTPDEILVLAFIHGARDLSV
ncbi:MAG: type II toxin-antitoxin system RelE/ParE family toxin [Candidatus Hydrogenedentes bacterium]|nr:type II toxin-antitoxin system RelE/ParE family toxin [Candidatus Hydrogenedentota bacterium]